MFPTIVAHALPTLSFPCKGSEAAVLLGGVEPAGATLDDTRPPSIALVPDREWARQLDQNWNREAVAAAVAAVAGGSSEFSLQAESEQRPHKISFTLTSGEVWHLVG